MIHEERVVPREKISPVSLRNKEMGFFYRIGKFFLFDKSAPLWMRTDEQRNVGTHSYILPGWFFILRSLPCNKIKNCSQGMQGNRVTVSERMEDRQ